MILAKKVRHTRLIRELSQQELARRAGVSVSTVVRVEGGQGRLPREQTVHALAAALGVTPGWLTDDRRELADLLHREAAASAGGRSPAEVGEDGLSEWNAAGEGGDVQGLLRRAIRAIERSRPAASVPTLQPGQPDDLRLPTVGVEPWTSSTARMAPVFDIGADFDRDWHDGGFPTGQGQDERPAFNGDPSGFWCSLRGDSMEPELFDGDLLYFSPEWTRPSDGDICLIRTHDFATVKRFYKIGPTTARLAASNPRYPDRIVDLVEDVTQLHKAFCFVRPLV